MPPIQAGITDPAIILTTSQVFLFILKAMFLIGGALYLVFSLLIIRQVQLMRSTVVTALSWPLVLIGIIHAFLALLAMLFYLTL